MERHLRLDEDLEQRRRAAFVQWLDSLHIYGAQRAMYEELYNLPIEALRLLIEASEPHSEVQDDRRAVLCLRTLVLSRTP